MKRAVRRAALAATLLAVASACSLSCASVRTRYDVDPDTDFGAWRSYAWYPGGSDDTFDPRLDNPLLHRTIVASVDETLRARGFVVAEDRVPDFYVNYHLSVERRLQAQTMDRTYVGGPNEMRWGGMGWAGPGWSEAQVEEVEEGTLVLDFVDAGDRQLVWRGSGTRRLERNPGPERVRQNVKRAVEEILAPFPPGS